MDEEVRIAIGRGGTLVAELGKLAYLIENGGTIVQINNQFNRVLQFQVFVNTTISTLNREIGRKMDEAK